MVSKRIWQAVGCAILASGLAVIGGLRYSKPLQARETTPGITIFGGIDSEYRLGYSIDFNEPYSHRARYYLRVTGNRLPREVTEIEITYPEEFATNLGRIEPNTIEVRKGRYRGQDPIELDNVILDEDTQTIEIYPTEAIPADTDFVVVLSRVHNPRRYGIHYFNLKMMYQGDVLRQYIGTWPLEVAAEGE